MAESAATKAFWCSRWTCGDSWKTRRGAFEHALREAMYAIADLPEITEALEGLDHTLQGMQAAMDGDTTVARQHMSAAQRLFVTAPRNSDKGILAECIEALATMLPA